MKNVNSTVAAELDFIPAFEGVLNGDLTAKYGYPVFIVTKSNLQYWTILGNGGAVAASDTNGNKHICVCRELLDLWEDELEVILLHEKGHLHLNHHKEMVNANKSRRIEMEIEADEYAVRNHSKGITVGAAYLLRVLYTHDSEFFASSPDRASSLLTYRYGL